jgi:YD repeat-containing protein
MTNQTMKSKANLIVAVVLLVTAIGAATPVFGQDPVFDVAGFHQNHDYFSQLPFEHIDTLTGGLVLTFTDLVLPGNAGRELRFQRSYNSKGPTGAPWTFGIAGVPIAVINPDGPHDLPPETPPPTMMPVLVTVDGAWRRTAFIGPNVVMTDDFWKYDRALRRAELPDGTVCSYDTAGLLAQCSDAYGEIVVITRTAGQVKYEQKLGNDHTREVIATLNAAGFPTTLSYAGKTWTYDYGSSSSVYLASVSPPVGRPWQYEYGNPLLSLVRTPHGGEIAYTFELHQFSREQPLGQIPVQVYSQVVTSRTQGGRDVIEGTWSYSYENVAAPIASVSCDTVAGNRPIERTTVTMPAGDRVIYGHSLISSAAGTYHPEPIYGVVTRTVEDSVGNELEREKRCYVDLPNADGVSPALAERRITRDGQDYTTTHQYHSSDLAHYADYHQPFVTTETGQLIRTTNRVFDHGFNRYIVGRLASESVTVGPAFTKSWTYDHATGFVQSATVYGITTTFASDGLGNVATVTKANGTSTRFSYSWGVVSEVQTSAYTISRDIKPEGTIASETRAGRETTFTYDDLFRVKVTQPPGANAIMTDYHDDDWSAITVSRGASFTTTALDGFGRPIGTTNSAGVKTTTRHDADGRATYRGYPFTGAADVGVSIAYDGLGRVIRETNSDESYRDIAYGNGTVTITDENGYATIQTRQAFGDPDDSRLAALNDALDNTWTYNYNTLGRLQGVTAPDGIVRTWLYDTANGKDLLISETHPESGTTSYDSYDGAGNLKQKTDANGTVFKYTYDANNRLRIVEAGTRRTDITYEPGTDNRQMTSVGSVSSWFQYESTTGRLASRTDFIDGAAFTTGFTYDNNDVVRMISYPALGTSATNRRQIQYDVDSENRITNVFETSRPYASGIQYHPSGSMSRFVSGNGIENTVTYHLTRYWVQSIHAGSLDLTYSDYDGVGNVRQILDSRPGMNETFDYDRLDRLAVANGPGWAATYGYDVHGNRQGGGQTYYPGTLRLWTQGIEQFSYDNNGNLTAINDKTFTYTPNNLLESAAVTGGTTTYGYDTDDWRVRKTSGGVTTYYLRGLHGELLTEWKNPGTSGETRDYVYVGTRLISAISRSMSDTSGDYFGTIVANGPTVTAPLSPVVRNARLLFEGVAGERVSAYAQVTSGGFGCVWSLSILKPDGTMLGAAVSCGGTTFLEPLVLPVTGRYTLLVAPSTAGTANVNLYQVIDTTGTITPNGPAVPVTITTPGQRAFLTFTGSAGGRFSAYAHVTNGGFGCVWYLMVVKPDGTPVGSAAISCGGESFLEPIELPVTGSYSVVVDPSDINNGSATINLYQVNDTTGTITVTGPPVPISLTTPGQRAFLTFSGTAGQRVSAYANTTSGGFGCLWYLSILQADGTPVSDGSAYSCGSANFLEPVTLPVTGTYSVVIDPGWTNTGAADVSLYEVVDVTGPITANGSAVPVSLTTPGQRALLTFSGVTGQRVSASAAMTNGGFGCLWYLTILKPDGTTLAYNYGCFGGTTIDPVTLPADGTYTIVVDPSSTNTGAANITLTNVGS